MKQKNLFLVKILCLNILLFLLSANKILATSPNHEWTIGVPSVESTTTGVGASNGVFADDQGNTYVVGSFSGEADFGAGQDSAYELLMVTPIFSLQNITVMELEFGLKPTAVQVQIGQIVWLWMMQVRFTSLDFFLKLWTLERVMIWLKEAL